jgi:predicted RNA-binding Zn ribbon-like protein
MQWIATERVSGLVPAPGSLAFVQDLLNSTSDGWPAPRHIHPDLLLDLTSAQEWLTAAGRSLGEARGVDLAVPSLSEKDLPALREIREELRQLISRPADADEVFHPTRLAAATVTIETSPGPRFVTAPAGEGWRWVASAVLTECLNAQQDGTWRRLKICPNPSCVATFYDQTRNNNGVWHSTRSCGNPANLRASRARKRESTQ